MIGALAIAVPLVIATATVGFGAKGGVIAARGIITLGGIALAGWLLIMVGALIAYNTEPNYPLCAELRKQHPYPYGTDCR